MDSRKTIIVAILSWGLILMGSFAAGYYFREQISSGVRLEVSLKKADQAYHNMDYSGAVAAYSNAVREDADNQTAVQGMRDSYFMLAESYVEAGEYDAAFEAMKELERWNKDSASVIGRLMVASMLSDAEETEDEEERKKLYGKVLAVDDENEAAYAGLIQAALRKQDYGTALAWLEIGLDSNPGGDLEKLGQEIPFVLREKLELTGLDDIRREEFTFRLWDSDMRPLRKNSGIAVKQGALTIHFNDIYVTEEEEGERTFVFDMTSSAPIRLSVDKDSDYAAENLYYEISGIMPLFMDYDSGEVFSADAEGSRMTWKIGRTDSTIVTDCVQENLSQPGNYVEDEETYDMILALRIHSVMTVTVSGEYDGFCVLSYKGDESIPENQYPEKLVKNPEEFDVMAIGISENIQGITQSELEKLLAAADGRTAQDSGDMTIPAAAPSAGTGQASAPGKGNSTGDTPGNQAIPAPETITVGISTEGFAEAVVEQVNAERKAAGLSGVTMTEELNTAAKKRAEEIISLFAHSRPDGSSCFTVLDEYGIYYMAAGENIAAGQTTPASVMDSWMNSQGHKANILNGSYRHIGVACIYIDSGYGYYWVQLFTD